MASSTLSVVMDCILAVLGAAAVVGPFLEPLAFVPFLVARSLLRIRRGDRVVHISGLDPLPMCVAGGVLFVVTTVAVTVTPVSLWLAIAAAIGVWFGSRLHVRVTASGTRVIRTFAYVLPWYWRTRPALPSAYTDGWGDFADPESLRLGFDGDDGYLELAWGDAHSGSRCDELAAEINAAVAAIGPSGGR